MEPDGRKKSRTKMFAEKRQALADKYSNGFSFSQDLTMGLTRECSQGSRQGLNQGFDQALSQGFSQPLSQGSDSTWYSGNSQSLNQPMSTVPLKQTRFDQLVPPSLPETKKAKYNLPSWAKGLLKTAEENQKLKNHDILLKQKEDETINLKVFLQDVQKSIAGYQELVAEMVKQSTDFLTKDFEKRNDDLKTELLKHVKDTLGQQLSCLTQQHLDNTFDTWNYLSEIKFNLDEIKISLNDKKGVSDIVITKVEQCCESILKLQQKIQENSRTDSNKEKEQNVQNVQNVQKNKVGSAVEAKQTDVLDESESDDVFQVSILRSRRKKRKTIFQKPQGKPNYTSTPIPNQRKKKTLLDTDEMYRTLLEVEE